MDTTEAHADALITTWLRGCHPAVQISVADRERLRAIIAAELEEYAGALSAASWYLREVTQEHATRHLASHRALDAALRTAPPHGARER